MPQSVVTVCCALQYGLCTCADAMQSIQDNYEVLQDLWEWSLENCSDTEMKARIRGHRVTSHMKLYYFFFGLCLGQALLQRADVLSVAFQHQDLSAAEEQALAAMTVRTPRTLRSDEQFQIFWKETRGKATACQVSEPSLPRQRSAPARFEDGIPQPEFHTKVEDHYRQIYYGVLDLLTTCLEDRPSLIKLTTTCICTVRSFFAKQPGVKTTLSTLRQSQNSSSQQDYRRT